MRFRASLRDPALLASMCATIRVFSKKALLKLHSQHLRIIAIPSTDSADGTQVWSGLRTDSLFSDLRIEAKSDSIFCEVPDMSQLVFALRSCARPSTVVVIKLAKVGSRQLLHVAMQNPSTAHDTVHEVPIRVLTEAEVARISAPPLQHDVTELILPPLPCLADFIGCARASNCVSCTIKFVPDGGGGGLNAAGAAAARLRNPDDLLAGDDVPSGGPETGRLSLLAEAPTMTFETHFGGVCPPAGVTLRAQPVAATVDLRRLARFLAVRDISPTSLTLHLADRDAVVLTAFAAAGSNLILYLPAVIR